jgi:hypothetical protein
MIKEVIVTEEQSGAYFLPRNYAADRPADSDVINKSWQSYSSASLSKHKEIVNYQLIMPGRIFYR